MSEKIVELPEKYKPSENEEYMNDYQLEYFRRKLIAWKQSLTKESKETIDHLKSEKLNEPDTNDRASIESDVNFELRTRDRYRKLIDKINAALLRIKNGSYGFCVKSFDPIGLKRLEARPIATLSIRAQEEHERAEKIYNDE
ncbi:RNA polymerase-binding protein DksA [Candidatus Aquarickettsia rohweri]|uniref:RNA polymerase-binding transcription factor DksA n=1 Tax=Candidatus Aquarickettsia rohweri TaxID=2602574 RepID=A0A3R9ZR21_9RICK|nr:RNA polymerase-binding protein DksA [Candidatus Aquarickettsia rohweri]MSO14287.1 RNA polymerase-binding transcription factor DksA [Rickettsiales endosymbiont of Trichoplax sp. H2]RST71886.1 RNA polymerase-binding protein DksA [Candidatus Aquarickettsia rohweri]